MMCISRNPKIMAASASQLWKTVRPHVPLIKFRKGGGNRKTSGTHAPGAAPAATSGGKVSVVDELPRKYARKPPTDIEIEYINRGGPE